MTDHYKPETADRPDGIHREAMGEMAEVSEPLGTPRNTAMCVALPALMESFLGT